MISWVVMIGGLYVWNHRLIEEKNYNLAKGELEFFFKQIKITRSWNATHGGVYVPITDVTQPNPYLKDPNRDIETIDGLKLTKINPAFMTRQISEIHEKEYDIYSHITSLNPIRPSNEPDDWEKAALISFERGATERFELIECESGNVFRFMAPLVTEISCLKCHEEQGYAVGDIRGGISVSIPACSHMELMEQEYFSANMVYPGIGILGLLGLWFRYRYKETQISNQEISQRVEKLNEENHTKETFLSMISHDLRTPFCGIIGITEFAIESIKQNNQDEAIELLGDIAESSKEGYALLDNLLQWSRLQAGHIVFEPKSVCLNELVGEIKKLLVSNLKFKGIEYKSELPESFNVWADRNLLYTILRNVLSNAIKFTNEKGCIEVFGKHCDEKTIITIRDNGVGMSDERQSQLFKEEIAFSSIGTKQEMGSGLGLLLCRDLMELHQGKLEIESQLGVGTTVTLILPHLAQDDGLLG